MMVDQSIPKNNKKLMFDLYNRQAKSQWRPSSLDISSFENVRPGINPLFLSQNIAQKLGIKKDYKNVKESPNEISHLVSIINKLRRFSEQYLPEKKIPSTHAKAKSLSANERELQ